MSSKNFFKQNVEQINNSNIQLQKDLQLKTIGSKRHTAILAQINQNEINLQKLMKPENKTNKTEEIHIIDEINIEKDKDDSNDKDVPFGGSTLAKVQDENFKNNLKKIKKQSGMLQDPSELMFLDSMIYFEKRKMENLTNIVHETNNLKNELTGYDYIDKTGANKRYKGIAELCNDIWLQTMSNIDLKHLPIDIRKKVADEACNLEKDRRLGILDLKYPSLRESYHK